MRKFFVFIVGLFVVGTVFAVGENVPTSKSYVDTAVAQKQDTIPANSGTAQVLTNTGTPGDVGTKNIYDSSAAYAGQTDALVTAGTMNTAVQNAIESEFQCIEYDANGECLLINIISLPAEYTRLQYLESTRTQYIDSGVPAAPNIGVAVKYAFTDIFAYNEVFGSFSPHYYLGISSTGKSVSAAYGPTTGNSVLRIPVEDVQTNHIYKFNMNLFESGKVEFVGISSAQLPERNFDNAKYNMSLFGVTYISGTIHRGAVRIYDMQITSGNQLVRNFIPARRNSDGETGMYDLVSNTFFTNSGSGEFIAGEFTSNN